MHNSAVGATPSAALTVVEAGPPDGEGGRSEGRMGSPWEERLAIASIREGDVRIYAHPQDKDCEVSPGLVELTLARSDNVQADAQDFLKAFGFPPSTASAAWSLDLDKSVKWAVDSTRGMVSPQTIGEMGAEFTTASVGATPPPKH